MRRTAFILLAVVSSLIAGSSSRAMHVIESSRTTRIFAANLNPPYASQEKTDAGPADGSPWTSELVSSPGVGAYASAYQDSLASDTELRATGNVDAGSQGCNAQSHYRV